MPEIVNSNQARDAEQRRTDERLADLLEKLANGDTVVLGEFSDNASPATEPDTLAAQLHEMVAALRSGDLQV